MFEGTQNDIHKTFLVGTQKTPMEYLGEMSRIFVFYDNKANEVLGVTREEFQENPGVIELPKPSKAPID